MARLRKLNYWHGHSARLFRASGRQAGSSLAWKPIPGTKSFNQASGLKDGLQPRHSIKGNALRSAHTQSLHLVRLQARSIINDNGSAGINWYPSVRPSIQPYLPHAHQSCRRKHTEGLDATGMEMRTLFQISGDRGQIRAVLFAGMQTLYHRKSSEIKFRESTQTPKCKQAFFLGEMRNL